jgi:hypothetical protein
MTDLRAGFGDIHLYVFDQLLPEFGNSAFPVVTRSSRRSYEFDFPGGTHCVTSIVIR